MWPTPQEVHGLVYPPPSTTGLLSVLTSPSAHIVAAIRLGLCLPRPPASLWHGVWCSAGGERGLPAMCPPAHGGLPRAAGLSRAASSEDSTFPGPGVFVIPIPSLKGKEIPNGGITCKLAFSSNLSFQHSLRAPLVCVTSVPVGHRGPGHRLPGLSAALLCRQQKWVNSCRMCRIRGCCTCM